ncbi:MAG: type II secretion system protein, partial [Bacilli bacterium]|nr:type II secretion system protein [Bacilli bacterium]
MKKGFTLVELLAVIALLGVLAVIVAPAVNGSLQKSQNNLVEVQEKQIIKAAKDYYAEHLSELPTGDITDTKTLSYLQTEGYLSISLVDPKTKKNYDV